MRLPTSAPPDVQAAFRDVWEALRPLVGPGSLDLRGRSLVNAGAGVDPFDVATLDDVQRLLDAWVPPAAKPAPAAPSSVYYGTHEDRVNRAPTTVSEGALFWETDRAALYQRQIVDGAPAWVLALCRPLRTADSKPADLDTNDAGFTWFDQVAGVTYRWSGGAWNYYLGSVVDVLANRPDLALADRGFLFIASDHGHQVWRKDLTAWVLLEGVGGPARGTLGAITGGLTTTDAGYRYHATDYAREYRWTGTAWEDAPGQPARYQIAFFDVAPGAGWALCNGAATTISTATGGTTSYTRPDLISAPTFLRANSTAGGTGGSATTHTHSVDPASTESGDPMETVQVAAGTDLYVGSGSHHHMTNVAATTSGGPSGAGGVDALPPFRDALPYVRL